MIEDGTHRDAAFRDGEERLLATADEAPLPRRCFRSHRQGWGQAATPLGGAESLGLTPQEGDSGASRAELKGTEGPEPAATRSAPRSQIVISLVDTGGVLTEGRDRTTEIRGCHSCAILDRAAPFSM